MPNIELEGVIVDRQPDALPGVDTSHDGLYLKTDDGKCMELVYGSMAQQMPFDVLWRRSRAYFVDYLGKRVTVSGFRNHRTIYSASIVKAEPLDD